MNERWVVTVILFDNNYVDGTTQSGWASQEKASAKVTGQMGE